MDRILLQHRLALAQEHVAAGEAHITRQHRLIWALDLRGHDATEAWCLLAEFETALALDITDRDQIIKVLAASEEPRA